jgi:hypothetical protein
MMSSTIPTMDRIRYRQSLKKEVVAQHCWDGL